MDKNLANLITRAQQGDKSALIELIKSQESSIYSTLYYLKKDDNEISDIYQNVLLKLTSKIHTLKNPEYFKTWLNRIILNTYYDYLRKYKRKSELYKNSEVPPNLEDESASIWNNILTHELDLIIKNSINSLPEHYKIPITLREIQGFSYEDISNLTNVSIGTVKSRIARARGKIRNDIEKYQKE